jgi:quinoprotein glucose dehydrogenase
MPYRTLIISLAFAFNATGQTTAPTSPEDLPDIHLVRAFPRLTFSRPIFLDHAPDGRLFVVEQKGRIRVFENRRDADQSDMFLDISERVHRGDNEEGLLGFAFHPRYGDNGHFYVYYSAEEPRRGILSRFTVSADDPNRADPDSEKVVMVVEQPYGNHNGSTVLFGPDGYLYYSLGDGGWANDPKNNGQNLSTLLGTILRIDVDREADGRPYSVPADNPFVGRDDARPEIWAYGLRNVWRMSFDRETGDLWAGDVGQNRWEEVDLIVKGGNYGWRIREGRVAFRDGESTDPLLDPIVVYPRADGLSITGGYVYRGTANPGLVGAYLFADYVTGRVWGLRLDDEGRLTQFREIHRPLGRPVFVTSFGEDADGELYVCGFDNLDGRRGAKGRVYVVREK